MGIDPKEAALAFSLGRLRARATHRHTGMYAHRHSGTRLHLACALVSVLSVHAVCGPLNAQPKQGDPWRTLSRTSPQFSS